MSELKIPIDKGWLKEEEALMKRIADHVVGREDHFSPERQDSGYNWQLDSHNDWWAEFDLEKRQDDEALLVLAYRYGREEFMEPLRAWLTWRLR